MRAREGPPTGEGVPVGTEFDDEFAEFVTRWSPALLRVAFLLTSDRGEAEDLLQTALLKTSRHWGRLSDREAAYAYVRRVLVTTHTSWRRRRRVHEVLLDQFPDRAVSEPSAIDAGRALHALEQLPPRCGRWSCCAATRASPRQRRPTPSGARSGR